MLVSVSVLLVLFWTLLKWIPYPQLAQFYQRPVSTRIYDKNQHLVHIVTLDEGLHREFWPLQDIPDLVQKILVASEDSKFFYHFGIDPIALWRAAHLNSQAGRVVSGASTITMQVARIITPRPRNFYSKFVELFDAMRLEAKLTKLEILELYLNNVPFGFQTEGVGSAARTFFGKDLTELNTSEILSMAIIPRNPSWYSPKRNYEANQTMATQLGLRIHVLDNADAYIPPPLQDEYNYPKSIPHYVQWLRKRLPIFLPCINLALDESVQRSVETLLEETLYRAQGQDLVNGAVLIVQRNNGHIITYVGSQDYDDKINSGAIDGIQIQRQPADLALPFLYATAYEDGNHDLPPFYINNIGLLRQLFEQIDPTIMANKWQSLQLMSSPIDKDVALDMSLGVIETSLWQLVQAYTIFAQAGKYLQLQYQQDDKTIDGQQMFQPQTIEAINDLLHQANIVDGSTQFLLGTESVNRQNLWTIGLTSDYIIGVWMGNFAGNATLARKNVAEDMTRNIIKTLEDR